MVPFNSNTFNVYASNGTVCHTRGYSIKLEQHALLRKDIVEKFHEAYEYSLYFREHTFVRHHQKACLEQDIANLDASTMVIVTDFKENIKLPRDIDQIGSEYFNKEQRTLFNATVFVKGEGGSEKTHHDIISKILNHDSHYVQHYLRTVIREVCYAR